jgi:hypothetical protein
MIAKNVKTERTGFRGSGCMRNLQKICNAKAYLLGAEPEFLECEILGATEIFSTRVAFFWENGMDQEQQQRVHAPVTIY